MPGVGSFTQAAGNAGDHIFRLVSGDVAGSGDAGAAGHIQGVFIPGTGDVAVLLQQSLAQLGHILLAQLPGCNTQQRCHARGSTHSLTADGAGAHDPGGGHSQLADADIPACHHQVGHIFGVEAAVGDGIVAGEIDVAGGQTLVMEALFRVHIDGPAAVGHAVIKEAVFQNVIFVQNIVAHQSPGFPDAGHRADPVHGVIFRMVAGLILDVIPHAENGFEQLIIEVFCLLDDILALAAQLHPPVAGADIVLLLYAVFPVGPGDIAVGTVLKIFFGVAVGPVGLDKGGVLAHIGGVEENGVAHGEAVFGIGGIRFLEFGPAFGTVAEFRTGVIAQGTVTGGIHKHIAFQPVHQFRGGLAANHRGNAFAVHLNIVHDGVQVAVQIGLGLQLAPHDHIPHGEGIVGIHLLVQQLQLHENAGFRQVLLFRVAVGTADMHPHFGAVVAAEDRPGLHNGSAGTLPGRGQSSTDAGKTAADDNYLIFLFDHFSLAHGDSSRR